VLIITSLIEIDTLSSTLVCKMAHIKRLLKNGYCYVPRALFSTSEGEWASSKGAFSIVGFPGGNLCCPLVFRFFRAYFELNTSEALLEASI
jgi:hypothetical protein